MFTHAGDDEVAEATQSGEGLGMGAGGDAEAGYFGEAAGDESGLGVIAKADTVTGAGGDSDDVFHGAAEFNTDDVARGINAEGAAGESALEEGCGIFFWAGDDDGGGDELGDFFGVAGSREDGDVVIFGEDIGSDLGHSLATLGIKALGSAQ